MVRFLVWPVFLSIFLSSCHTIYDKNSLSRNINEQQLEELTKPYNVETKQIKKKKPQIQKREIPSIFYKKISLTINDEVSVKEALYEAAKQIEISIQIDSNIDTTMLYSAQNKPFIEILDSICDMANMRYTIQNNSLSITQDTPFTVIYQTQFLNLVRDSANTISTNSDITSSNVDKDKEKDIQEISQQQHAQQQKMENTITTTAHNGFWDDLDNGLKIILNNSGTYSVNKQTGTIAVCANAKTHSYVRKYLQALKNASEAQVLIETKIIEVSLNKQYKHGIKWDELTSAYDHKIRVLSQNGNFDFTYATNNINYLTSFLEHFGVVRTVSNPRVTVMNNQPAILKVATNHVYFKINYDHSLSFKEGEHEMSSTSSDIRTIPIGLILFVQPAIDTENGTVTLFLRPTLSKLNNNIADPAVDIAMLRSNKNVAATDTMRSKVPVTDVREISSILKLNDGEVAILGGFMEIKSSKQSTGLPMFRKVFDGSHENSDDIIELVILIKVHILDKETHKNNADLRLLRFVPDPRPFF